MGSFILAIILLALAISGVVVRKTYYYVPFRELQRRAEHRDPVAERLYPAVSYGESLRVLLWAWIGLTTAGAFILLARIAPTWLGLLGIFFLFWVISDWLPASRVTGLGVSLTSFVTPVIMWILSHTHRPLSQGAAIIQKTYTAAPHTGLFERRDLLELIEDQQRQPDNRISDEELEIAKRALQFSDHKVADVMIMRKQVKTALASDTVGPVLIDELHKNGQGYLLVRETAKGDFVGTLAFKRLTIRSSGQVKNIMDKNIYYLHENDGLDQALHAFFKTDSAVFVVINSAKKYVGILTIDALLRQLLGHVPGDSFESYDDAAAVGARHPKLSDREAQNASEERGRDSESSSESDAVSEDKKITSVKTEDKVIE